MNKIFEMLGGSHAYGLDTIHSDMDVRGVFLHTDLKFLLGLEKFDHQVIQDKDPAKLKKDKQDEQWYELRHFLRLLAKTNSQCMEMLYSCDWIANSPLFALIQENRLQLINSVGFFNSMNGYMRNEAHLAFHGRADLESIHHKAFEAYGYVPSNTVHAFRLAWAGEWFFKHASYPVRVDRHDSLFADFLLKIKLNPSSFNAVELLERFEEAQANLKTAFETRRFNFEFNWEYANEICIKAYIPVIMQYKNNNK